MAKPMPVTGRVLAWALVDRELSTAAAAERLNVDEEVLNSWIEEDAHPNKGQFDALVKLLACNDSFLFLPEPPKSSRDSVAQFRKHAGAPDQVPEETAEAMRTAQTVLRITAWLAVRAERDGAKWPVVPESTAKESSEVVAQRLRSWLNWSVADYWGSKTTETEAAKALRTALQDQRIVVMHMTMDEGVTRGFSLHDGPASVMAINTRDHVRARIFSYAHELAHLSLRDDSVCLTRNDSSYIERFCNRVAGALLMPEQGVREFVNRRLGGRVESVANVVTLRNYFKVSLQAAAIRAENLGLASEQLYGALSVATEQKSSGGTYRPGQERTRPVLRVDQYGSGFVNSLFEAEESGHLKRTHVLDLLHLSARELDRVRELASSGT